MFIIPLRLYTVLIAKLAFIQEYKNKEAFQSTERFLCEFLGAPDLLNISKKPAFGVYCVFLCAAILKGFSDFHRHLLGADCTKSQPLPIANAPIYSPNESWQVKTHLCAIVWPHKKSSSDVTAVSDVGLHPGPAKQR